MKSPKFTDAHRYQKPYRSAAESRQSGYLAERFKEYAFAAPQPSPGSLSGEAKSRIAVVPAVAAPDDHPIAECFRVTA